MSSATQTTASPRPPRGKHQRSRSGNPPAPNNNETRGGRRPRGNRAHKGPPQGAGHQSSGHDAALVENAVFTSEAVAIPAGSRDLKKQTHHQPERAGSSPPDTDSATHQSTTTPAKAHTAYAGPTFHASPAPSTLPIPKFLSKSVPAKTRVGPPTPPPDDGSDSGSSPTPSPSRPPIPNRTRHQDSPLNMLFAADRAERARNPNTNFGPAIFTSPSHSAVDARPEHPRHDSYPSHNAPFPIELDGDNNLSNVSPPAPSPAANRPITVPSDLPQNRGGARSNEGADAINNLLSRLSMSQKNTVDPPPPQHMPSDPSLRNHTPPSRDHPSLVRSSSGPATPAPAVPQDDPSFFYGNRNLSPMFKAVSKRPDEVQRNSGLRTEITADSTLRPQGALPLMAPANLENNGVESHAKTGTGLNNHPNMRRGSAPHVPSVPQSYRGSPNHHSRRGAGRPQYNGRSDFSPQAQAQKATADRTTTSPAPSPKVNNMMAFIPSSVRAKAKPQATCPPEKSSPPPSNISLEQDLKRMLNLGLMSNGSGSH
ncbi:unnamed protein product [Periconia digitata]|uniref:Proteophosphoglycan 5 n=1 Tax=Periconia digitata TaxID=1303443 RepID=A0A9W4XIL2_9PLEO|nr:unnamed protein product [Periconia digitata]